MEKAKGGEHYKSTGTHEVPVVPALHELGITKNQSSHPRRAPSRGDDGSAAEGPWRSTLPVYWGFTYPSRITNHPRHRWYR
jgi:hypothetical protein